MVEFFPKDTCFVPLGEKLCEVDRIILKVEELEAMRLKDTQRLNQEECAERMQISRQTFQNIIDEARRKVTEALTQGKTILIQGGNYKTYACKMECNQCHNAYSVEFSQDKKTCPKCGSKEVGCTEDRKSCKKWCL